MTFFNLVGKLTKLLQSAFLPYQFGFVQGHSYLGDRHLDQIRGVLESRDEEEKQKVVLEYEEKFAKLVGVGGASSFASGRMAFYVLMEVLGIGDGDEVVLTAFTCSVMPNAVMKRGASPVYADMDRDTFGSSASSIQKVITNKTKLIVAQHSFGIPCDIDQIARMAKERGIFVVEDCAITLDSSLNGIKVGNWGGAAIFSTDHSKPLNTIIGGMLYTQHHDLHERIKRVAKMSPPLSDKHQRNLYAQMLFERRHYVPARYPQARIFNFFKRIGLGSQRSENIVFLESDYGRPSCDKNSVRSEEYPYPAAMPAFLTLLGLFELARWDDEKARRKKLLFNLINVFKQSRFGAYLPGIYFDATRDIVPLRFVFCLPASDELLLKLTKYIDVNWLWFRQPVAGAAEGLSSLQYESGSCNVSEEVCSTIINLPCNVTEGSEHLLLRETEESLA